MAEGGIVERLFGGEGGGEGEPEGLASGLDPTAAALAANAARSGDPLPAEVITYFKEQAHLVHLQTEHLHEQREVQLSHLKLRRFTDRLRAGIQIFVILVATVIGLAVLAMFCDALTSRSVVVDAFKAPTALAGRGLTGEVVASGVLDGLQKLQEATRSPDQSLSARNAWSSDIKVEVPDTGVSIGEIDRLLHEQFGHDLHINGDLVQSEGGGLALTVRGDGVPASTFIGAGGELDKLTTQAAEYVYGRSQPIRFATYLVDAGRGADSLLFLPGAFGRASADNERARLANAWGNAYAYLGQLQAAMVKYRLAHALAPAYSSYWWTSGTNLTDILATAQGEEAGWREGEAFLKAAAAAPAGRGPALRLVSYPAQLTWDLPLMLASDLADLSAHGSSDIIDGPRIADDDALLHDLAQAERHMAASDPNDVATRAEAFLLQGYAALDRGEAAGAVKPLEGFYGLWLATPALQTTGPDQPCFLARAYGLAGRPTEAEAVFKRVSAPWSRCYAFQGEVLAHRGDVVGAERTWSKGLVLLPDLPGVYLARGSWRMEHGDLRGADADFVAASGKAPRYADPWKASGDLLAKQGRWKEAIAKYDIALKLAPAWAALHQARDIAAQRH